MNEFRFLFIVKEHFFAETVVDYSLTKMTIWREWEMFYWLSKPWRREGRQKKI
jgi:hypothetical protein